MSSEHNCAQHDSRLPRHYGSKVTNAAGAVKGGGMDQAWDIGRRVIVDAIELSYHTEATSGPYECVGCGCPVTPAALTSEHVTPYFRAGRQQPHLPDCQIAGDPVLVRSSGPLEPARTERLGGGVSVPYQLVRAERREQVDPHAPQDPERQSSQSRTSSTTTSEGKRGLREATASTIRPFCRTFTRYPNSRTVLRINLPDVDAQHYQYAFKRLDLYAITDYPHQRIFYAEVAWSSPPEFTTNTAVISLYAGDRDPDNRARVARPYRVVIDWSTWGTKLRAALRREITAARREARESTGSEARSWLFFLAQQEPLEPERFWVNHHADYAFITAHLTYPNTKKPITRPRMPRRA